MSERGSVIDALTVENADLRARLAAVEALCSDADVAAVVESFAATVRAAARGEGDRPAVSRQPHDPAWCEMGGGWACQNCLDRQRGEGDRPADTDCGYCIDGCHRCDARKIGEGDRG